MNNSYQIRRRHGVKFNHLFYYFSGEKPPFISHYNQRLRNLRMMFRGGLYSKYQVYMEINGALDIKKHLKK